MRDYSVRLKDPGFKMDAPALVEASAGTGKTYNIQNAYLRLILGHQLKVDSILVVTFTEAATHELRDRLRKILSYARAVLEGRALPDSNENDRVREMLAAAGVDAEDRMRRADALGMLKLAMMDFDNAAIFTIHGFCNRVLERYAFECGHDPLATLATDTSKMIEDACKDWWRRNAYESNGATDFKSVEDLAEIVRSLVGKTYAQLAPEAPEYIDLLPDIKKECDILCEAIGGLTGKGVWCDGYRFRRIKSAAEVLDAAPLMKLCGRATGLPVLGDEAPESSLFAALAYIGSLQAHPPCADDDAQPFKRALKKISEDAEGFINAVGQKSALEEVLAEVRRRVVEEGVLTYDDMLRNVLSALESDGGEELCQLLRDEFKAAMIDEFQDTDSVQYAIFKELFGRGDIPLVYVGDPKQAIYGFRGGDVFTYYQARRAIAEDRRFNLGTNFRSEAQLVAAVNELFKDSGMPGTFRHEAIPYDGELKANGVPESKVLVHPEDSAHPIRIWDYEHDGSKKPGLTVPLVATLIGDMADEIVRLISDDGFTIGSERVQPRHIAVLVRTHSEASLVSKALHVRRVNAVLQNTGNVFDTREARELALLLQAMLSPADAYAVRGALACGIVPCSFAEILAFRAEDGTAPTRSGEGSTTLDEWMDIFRAAGEEWRDSSVIGALNYFMTRTRMRAHLVKQSDGERRLTNLLHLSELLNESSGTLGHGPRMLLDWYRRQLDESTREQQDEHLMRLASDEDAVRIMTVYKSKGLEFPIVFIPTLWRKKAAAKGQKDKVIGYHGAAGERAVTIDVNDESAKAMAAEESFQEDIRLIYVAVTRAANRVYLTQVGPLNSGVYALDWVLENHAARMADGDGSAIEIVGKSGEVSGPLLASARSADAVGLEVAGTPDIDHGHGHTSFSSLEPNTQDLVDTSARDIDGESDPARASLDVGAVGTDIFSIPGGARTGQCWHEIFEDIDFQSERKVIARVVDDKIERYGICNSPSGDISRARRSAVLKMVEGTLDVPLPMPSGSDTFALRDIPLRSRRAELEFNFSLRQSGGEVRTTAIVEVLRRHWGEDENRTEFLESVRNWDRRIPRGFMTGFIDLVCCHRDRFYIIDWKSNRRYGRLADFGSSGIMNEMARNTYFLQYLIYSVALHGYLDRHLQDYDYERHFGSVFYVFLRGIANRETRGIFSDRPARELIADLTEVLAGGVS